MISNLLYNEYKIFSKNSDQIQSSLLFLQNTFTLDIWSSIEQLRLLITFRIDH